MRFLTGVTGPDIETYRHHPRLGLLVQPSSYGADTVAKWPVWAADNGCFALRGKPFDRGRWLRWLDGLPRAGCLFACAPDVLHWEGKVCTGDAVATLAQAEEYLPLIRSMGFPAALILQDGMTPEVIPWDELDWLFVGGSDDFKMGQVAHRIIQEATARRIPTHMGRVNAHGRLAYAAAIGCSTADGTFLRFAPKVNVPRMLRWFDKLDGGVQGVFTATGESEGASA
jgi:hypothetical protein